MNRENLLDAVVAAQNFIDRARELVRVQDANPEFRDSHPKQSGATKRASMDLTRALSKMRGAK
jgi:hypothetical protein